MRETDSYSLYILERYKTAHNLTGKQAFAVFQKHDIFEYIDKFYPTFHTMDYRPVISEIDAKIGL